MPFADRSMATRLLVILLLLLGALPGSAAAATALGKPCTADSQCAPPGQNRKATCQGSVLVTKDRLCLGGRCSDSVERRIECGGGVGLGNCDPIAGQCRGTAGGVTVSNRCPPRCLCRGNTLIVVTGRRGQGQQRCETVVTHCARGCACEPAPRCNPAGR